MFGVLLLLFVVAPIVELYVIVQVAGGIGIGQTILLMIVVSAIGASLAKSQGLSVVRRLQGTIASGHVPSAELADGALILLAGALMLAPGFISDCIALLLLFPPTRLPVRALLLRRIRAGGGIITTVGRAGPWNRAGSGFGPSARSDDGVWDVESWENPTPPPGRPELDR